MFLFGDRCRRKWVFVSIDDDRLYFDTTGFIGS
jgi:hypothetical protein